MATFKDLAVRIEDTRNRVLKIPRATAIKADVALGIQAGVFQLLTEINKAIRIPLVKLGDAPANASNAKILTDLQDELINSYGKNVGRYVKALNAAKQNHEAVIIFSDDRFVATMAAMLTKLQDGALKFDNYSDQVDDIVGFQNRIIGVLDKINNITETIKIALQKALDWSGVVPIVIGIAAGLGGLYLVGQWLGSRGGR